MFGVRMLHFWKVDGNSFKSTHTILWLEVQWILTAITETGLFGVAGMMTLSLSLDRMLSFCPPPSSPFLILLPIFLLNLFFRNLLITWLINCMKFTHIIYIFISNMIQGASAGGGGGGGGGGAGGHSPYDFFFACQLSAQSCPWWEYPYPIMIILQKIFWSQKKMCLSPPPPPTPPPPATFSGLGATVARHFAPP